MAAATQSPVRYSNDLSPFEDGLERKAYIDAVRDLVLNVTPPFTVGILGDWGTGKTTFMEQVRKGLPEGECRTVWFNLWEHERDADPIIAMLHEARRQLGKYLEDETSAAAEAQALAKAVAVPADPSTPSARLTRTQKIQLILTAVVLGTPAVVATAYAAASGILPWLVPLLLKVGSVGQKWVRDHAPQVWNLLKDATDLGKKGTDIWKNFRDAGKNDETHVDALKGQVTATAFETADREVSLKAQFQEVLALLTGAPEEDAEQANPEETAETGNKHRVVFFIDDLDRCSPEAAVTLLERIKLFLYNDYCVFVIGLDDIATQKAVARVHQFDAYDPARAKTSASVQRVQDSADQASSDRSSDKELDAQHYLEKIIQ
ncbi:MAG: KAP family NTPase, partial [Propionibacteriaceae bacterium]|nr:KAP family NTPase [Propionibacteriaceae bacterium]